jgi:glycosyltransferase involved in cell wall biosynthesis
MKLFILGQELEGKIGGGHTWLSHMKQGFDLVPKEDCDVYVITSVSMLPKLSEIPRDKKIVLRVDNVLKKSCNSDVYPFRGDKVSRMEAMKQIAEIADKVVFQSYWAKDYLNPFLKVPEEKTAVILNATDEKIFNDKGRKSIFNAKPVYLYSRSSNHDNKGWHLVYYDYQYEQRKHPEAMLFIAGRFSMENIPNNFDFFNGENIQYLGFIQSPEEMALYLRQADYFYASYHMDACSNSLIEAILCGCRIKYLDKSGGAVDIENAYLEYGKEYFYLERMIKEYKKLFEEVLC